MYLLVLVFTAGSGVVCVCVCVCDEPIFCATNPCTTNPMLSSHWAGERKKRENAFPPPGASSRHVAMRYVKQLSSTPLIAGAIKYQNTPGHRLGS